MLGLDAGAGDFDAKLKALSDAARSLTASRQPVDFASAAHAWAEQVKREPARPEALDERLAAAAQQEAVRPDADLARARDLQLASRAVARIAGRPSVPRSPRGVVAPRLRRRSRPYAAVRADCDAFAKQRWRTCRNSTGRIGSQQVPGAQSTDEAARAAREDADRPAVLARLAGEAALADTAAGRAGTTQQATAAATSPAGPARAGRAETLALAARAGGGP